MTAPDHEAAGQTVFTCSVDDGHPSDMRVAALLARHGLPATFYIPITNREGRPVLSAAALRTLDTGFEIGSHTRDHCYLDQVGPAEARRQIRSGKTALEDLLGHPVPGFCYPGGRFDATHRRAVREAGFAYARTTMNLRFDTGSDRFTMPTTIQFHPHARTVYLRNYLRGGHWSARTRALRIAMAEPCWLQRIEALFDHACSSGQVFHLWCHGWEIDLLDAWPALDAFLARVSGALAPSQCLANGALAARSFTGGRARHPTGRRP